MRILGKRSENWPKEAKSSKAARIEEPNEDHNTNKSEPRMIVSEMALSIVMEGAKGIKELIEEGEREDEEGGGKGREENDPEKNKNMKNNLEEVRRVGRVVKRAYLFERS